MGTFSPYLFGRAAMIPELIESLVDAVAMAAAERARRKPVRRDVPDRRLALRPGPDTPLWNALVRAVLPHLRRRGSKAQLARLLKVPRQRLQACFKAKYACLDAERTLLLVGWLGFLARGGTLVPSVRPGRPRIHRKGRKGQSVPGNL
jgi:hypothetical protein